MHSSRTSAQGPEVRFVTAYTGAFVVVTVCHVLGVAVLTGAVLLGTLVVAVSLTLPLGYAVAGGVCAWAYLTGFVVNSLGRLTFTDQDLLRCAALVAVGALAATCGGGSQSQPRRRNTTYSATHITAMSRSAKG